MNKQRLISLVLGLALALAALATAMSVADNSLTSATAIQLIACGGSSGGHC